MGWDASGPRDPAARGIDDGLFVSNALTAIQAGYCVSPARIAAAGFSNGGGLVGYLACVLASRIGAFAAVEAHPGEQDGPAKGQRGAGRRDDEGTGGR